MNWAAELRQKLYPREFRIHVPCGHDWQIAAKISHCQSEDKAEKPSDGGNVELPSQFRKLIVQLGTNLWRTRQKMIDPVSGDPPEHMRKAYRHVRSMWDALQESGIDIQDHTNQPFHLGQTLNAIAFEPRPDLSTDTVIETVKPTIYYQKRLIQMGEVIVGTPVC